MARHYKNFLDAYFAYSKDDFVPDKFHLWSGISAIAGAMERKTWVQWDYKTMFFPNLYVLLVSKPGIGKSSAIMPAVQMLREVSHHAQARINFIPSQVTEAKLVELMSHKNFFEYNNKQTPHCSGYYFASEASACLKDLYGGFLATITSFYDCDSIWEKGTVGMGEGEKLVLNNVCFNLIAGSTFDYLGTLLSGSSIMGGFASRMTYIIQNDAMSRVSTWQNIGQKRQTRIRQDNLLSDLFDIHQMVGPFSADRDFMERYAVWFPQFDKKRQELKSEKLQALMTRKPTLMTKLPMVLSAAESDDRILRAHHWDIALEMVDEVEKDLPGMLRHGQAMDTKSQNGLNQMFMKILANGAGGVMEEKTLMTKAMLSGFERRHIMHTLEGLKTPGGPMQLKSDGKVYLVGNPDDYL